MCSCRPVLPNRSVSMSHRQAASSPMVRMPYCSSRRAALRPTNSRADTGRGNTISRQFSGEMTVVASGFL